MSRTPYLGCDDVSDAEDDAAVAEEHDLLYPDGCYCRACASTRCAGQRAFNARLAASHGGVRADLLAAFALEEL